MILFPLWFYDDSAAWEYRLLCYGTGTVRQQAPCGCSNTLPETSAGRRALRGFPFLQ